MRVAALRLDDQAHMLSQIAKAIHRSPVERLLAGEAWGLRLIQSEADNYSASFIPLPPVDFDEECGPPTGILLRVECYLAHCGHISSPDVTLTMLL